MKTFNFTEKLIFKSKSDSFENCSKEEALRYLKGIYTNEQRFKHRFLNKISKIPELSNIFDFFKTNYSKLEPYSYIDAFNLKNQEFQAIVFGSINISEMIENLGKTRLKIEGKLVKRKTFFKNGDFDKISENNVIYETYEISGKKLNLPNNIYAVKCWCTTTNKEHWLWLEEVYKNNPLAAIASTFRFHENIIPYIVEMKRQGDIMLVELSKDIEPKGNIIPLTAEQYFKFLTAES